MSWKIAPRALGLCLSGSLAVCCTLGWNWEKKLSLPLKDGFLVYAQFSGRKFREFRPPHKVTRTRREKKKTYQRTRRGENKTYQRTRRAGNRMTAKYGFFNFNRDFLTVNFDIPKRSLEIYAKDYGYSDEDLQELKDWKKKAYDDAYDYIVGRNLGERHYKNMLRDIDRRFKRRREQLLASRGFKILPGNVPCIDMPEIVRRNRSELTSVAQTFQGIGDDHGYGSEDIVGAVTAMVQTALRYKLPPSVYRGRHTGGFLSPIESLVNGWGDCDTKTGLLASILSNWNGMRMVGVAVPNHYLMAIRRIPARGDMYVEYGGMQYVLIEPAGPAWLVPGSVGADTELMLTSGRGYKIEPFF